MSTVKFNDSTKFRDIYDKQCTFLEYKEMEDANINKMYPSFQGFLILIVTIKQMQLTTAKVIT